MWKKLFLASDAGEFQYTFDVGFRIVFRGGCPSLDDIPYRICLALCAEAFIVGLNLRRVENI